MRPIHKELVVRAPVERAFAVFVERVDAWWPPGHRRDGGRMQLEGRVGGRLVERVDGAEERVIATVIAWSPPERIALAWRPGAPVGQPTIAELTFRAEGAGTSVSLVHHDGEAPLADDAPSITLFHRGWDAVLSAWSAHLGATMPPAPQEAPMSTITGDGTPERPWQLTTANGGSAFTAHRDPSLPALVVRVGKTELRYQLRCLDDLHAMLKAAGDWVPLGGADEQKPAAEGTVEAWGRDPANPVGGWYGLKKGLRGRFGVYVPPVLEALGLVELEHSPKNNRVRAR